MSGFVCLLLTGLFYSVNLFAQSSDLFKLLKKESEGLSSQSQFGIGVSPLIQRPRFHPGALEKFSFNVSNLSENHMKLTPQFFGGIFKANGEVESKSIDKLSEDNLARWIKLDGDEVILPPKSKKKIIFKAKVPNTLKGTNIVYIGINGQNLNKDTDKYKRTGNKKVTDVGMVPSILVAVAADIIGQTDYKIASPKFNLIWKKNSVQGQAEIKNEGNGALFLQLWGTLTKKGESTPIGMFRREPIVLVQPYQKKIVSTEWLNNTLQSNAYDVLLVITEKDKRIEDIQSIFSTGPKQTSQGQK